MSLTRVKDKFQVTIPAAIRKKLGIKIGDILEAEAEDDRILLQPQVLLNRTKAQAVKEFTALVQRMGARNKDFSDEEVMEDILQTIQEVRQERHDKGRGGH